MTCDWSSRLLAVKNITSGQFFVYFHKVKAKFGSSVVFVTKRIFEILAVLAVEENKAKKKYVSRPVFCVLSRRDSEICGQRDLRSKKIFFNFWPFFCSKKI